MTARRLWRDVSIVVTGGLLAVNLLSLASGSDWRLDLLTHFRVQYTGLFLVLAIVLMVQKQRAMTVAALFGLILNGWLVAPIFISIVSKNPSPAEEPAVTMSILHFNVNAGNVQETDVISLVLESGADVVFFHEVTPAWALAFEGLLGSYTTIELAPRLDNFGVGMWVRDGSGVECMSSRVVEIAAAGEETLAVDARVRAAGKDVRLFAVHTPPPLSGRFAASRDAQLESAGLIASSADIPFVLVGDLNATPWSSAYRAMVKLGDLRDSLIGRGCFGCTGASWPAWLPALARIPIDHCLTRGGVTVLERRLGDAAGSDHRSLYVRIRVD